MENQPIIIGLAGKALTGKTRTGNRFAPLGSSSGLDGIFWTHEYFAHPLYRMAGIMQKVRGEYALDRKQYEIYEILADLFNRNPLYGAPTWDVLVELTRHTSILPVPPEGEKARTFMQVVGSKCREIMPDCFVDTTIRLIKSQSRAFYRDLDLQEEMVLLDYQAKAVSSYAGPKIFGSIISDVRYLNEAKKILAEPMGFLVKLTARNEVRQQRALQRDGIMLTDEQQNHESELGLNEIPDDWYNAIIDTSDLTLDEQFEAVRSAIYKAVSVCPA